MPRLQLKISKIVGAATEKAWSQVYTFVPQEPEKLSQRGQLLAVISLSDLKEVAEIAVAGREVIARLHEEYYGQLRDSTFEALKKAVKKVTEEIGQEAQVEIIAGVVVGRILYLAANAGGSILVRRRQSALILKSSGEIRSASGYFQDKDLLLLASQQFLKVIDQKTLRKALTKGSVDKASEILGSLIHGQSGMALTAGVIIQNETEKKPEPVKLEKKSFKLPRPRFNFGMASFLKRKTARVIIHLQQRAQKSQADHQEKSKKMLMTVATVLIGLLVVSAFLGKVQRKGLSQREQLAVIFQQAQEKKEEGEALVTLNPSRAKNLLSEAQELINQIEEPNQEIEGFKQELIGIIAQVLREHEVEPSVLYDLELIKKGARATDAAFSGEDLFILDQSQSSVYQLSVADKKQKIIASGNDLKEASQITISSAKVFVLTDEGILRAAKKSSLVIEDELAMIDLQAFGNNFYLLAKDNIWAYSATESGFGEQRSWLKNEASLGNPIAMVIDGSIWVLKANGQVLKLTQGIKDAFAISGLDKPFNNPVGIYTDADQERLYILDQGNSRIVVLDKSGEYHSQYLTSQASQADHLVVSEEKGEIYLLSGSKIYVIEIK